MTFDPTSATPNSTPPRRRRPVPGRGGVPVGNPVHRRRLRGDEVTFDPTSRDAEQHAGHDRRRRAVLVGVACPAATQCTAVDIDRWRGDVRPDVRDAEQHPHAVDGGRCLHAVACPTATQCTAVDYERREVTFDPTSATPNSTPLTVDAGRTLLAVACPSTTQCTAVDSSGGEVTFDPTSGTPNAPRYASTPDMPERGGVPDGDPVHRRRLKRR